MARYQPSRGRSHARQATQRSAPYSKPKPKPAAKRRNPSPSPSPSTTTPSSPSSPTSSPSTQASSPPAPPPTAQPKGRANRAPKTKTRAKPTRVAKPKPPPKPKPKKHLPFTHDLVFTHNARLLFTADFQFNDDKVSEYLLPGIKRGCDLWRMKMGKLAEMRREILSGGIVSDEVVKHVFDFAKSYSVEHLDGVALSTLAQGPRNQIWALAFNPALFTTILQPVSTAVSIDQFIATSEWEEQYRRMFVAAADAMYTGAESDDLPKANRSEEEDENRSGEGRYPKVKIGPIYAAIRTAIAEMGDEKLTIEAIPEMDTPWTTNRKWGGRKEKIDSGTGTINDGVRTAGSEDSILNSEKASSEEAKSEGSMMSDAVDADGVEKDSQDEENKAEESKGKSTNNDTSQGSHHKNQTIKVGPFVWEDSDSENSIGSDNED